MKHFYTVGLQIAFKVHLWRIECVYISVLYKLLMIYQLMIIENAANGFRKLLKMCFSVILYLFIVYC